MHTFEGIIPKNSYGNQPELIMSTLVVCLMTIPNQQLVKKDQLMGYK